MSLCDFQRFARILRRTSGRRRSRLPGSVCVEHLEPRLTPTGNIHITAVYITDLNHNALPVYSDGGKRVDIEVAFTTQGLPSGSSYHIDYDLNGLDLSADVSQGAGDAGAGSWRWWRGRFVLSAGTNEITVTINQDHALPETNYSDNSLSKKIEASGINLDSQSFSASQIRTAYGVNEIPRLGSTAADGSGQTIAIVDAFNDPTILSDLDGFDRAMNLKDNASPTLYQKYGAAASILSVYNQDGVNITNAVGRSGANGVPRVDPTGDWTSETAMDVEWAHAIAPGAHIDLIETDSSSNDDLARGVAAAARLPGVTVVSMSFIGSESTWNATGGGELAYDSSTFVTPVGRPGVTFVASSGDAGVPGGFPGFSPNVVAVGGTALEWFHEAYEGEGAWNFPDSRLLRNGSPDYSETGAWTDHEPDVGYDPYATAAGGDDATATWQTTIGKADQGWSKGVEVSATWVASPDNTTDATYTIYDGAAFTGTFLGAVHVDQTQRPVGLYQPFHDTLQELGVYYPVSGVVTVVLSAASAEGAVVAGSVGVAPAWASGGGESLFEPEPSYQSAVQNSGKRTIPDVAFVADRQTGVTCFENGDVTYDNYGTSLGAPCWAALVAIANQTRAAAGLPSLNTPDDPTQTLRALYGLPAADFHDIQYGYNGRFAESGYDEVTGLGSPIANFLVPDLASFGQPAHLVVTQEPYATVSAGQTFVVAVAIERQDGEVETSFDGAVSIDLGVNPAGGALGGIHTVSAVNGVALFSDLTLLTAGQCTLDVSSNGMVSRSTRSVNVLPAVATRLVLHTPPSPAPTVGTPFDAQPVLYAEDQYGNIDTRFGRVELFATIVGYNGQLGGTTSVFFQDGVATFTDLSADKVGVGSLEFSSTRFNVVISAPIHVIGLPAALTFGNLGFAFDAAAHLATVTTNPAGLGGVTVTYTQNNVVVATPTHAGKYSVVATLDDPLYEAPPLSGTLVIDQATPTLLWETPADLPFGAPLGAAQLNASASAPGVFTYAPAAGAVLSSGQGQLLLVTFMPADLDLKAITRTTRINVLPPPPLIIGERALFLRKTNKKGKPVGSPTFAGFAFNFSAPLNAASAGSSLNYHVDSVTTKRVKKHTERVLHPITGFSVAYSPTTNTVTLIFAGKQAFTTGGQITILSGPSGGVTGDTGIALAGTTVFNIAPGGRKLTSR
jgi:MBG domain